jgi:tetratricopeptide (TPR) repeat protein
VSAKRREEVRHDWFADKMVEVGAYFSKYRRQFIIGGVGIIALVSAIFILIHTRGRAETDRWQRVSEAESLLMESIYGMGFDAEFDRPSFDVAIEELRWVYQTSPASPAAHYAMNQIGEAFYEIEDYESAIDAWRTLINNPAADPRIVKIAEGSLAVSLEQVGGWSEAAAIYRRRAEAATGEEAAREWWNLSRCLEQLDQPAEAQQARARAVELGAGTVWAELAELPPSPLKPLPPPIVDPVDPVDEIEEDVQPEVEETEEDEEDGEPVEDGDAAVDDQENGG